MLASLLAAEAKDGATPSDLAVRAHPASSEAAAAAAGDKEKAAAKSRAVLEALLAYGAPEPADAPVAEAGDVPGPSSGSPVEEADDGLRHRAAKQ